MSDNARIIYRDGSHELFENITDARVAEGVLVIVYANGNATMIPLEILKRADTLKGGH